MLGALMGELITFDTTGIDFAMTALFVVICVDQWKAARPIYRLSPVLYAAHCFWCSSALPTSSFLPWQLP